MLKRLAIVVLLALMAGAALADPAAAGTQPKVTWLGVTGITQTTATFNARADNGDEGFFEYEFRLCPTVECPNGMVTTERVTQSQGVGQNEPVTFAETVRDLRPNTQYSATLLVGNDTYFIGENNTRPHLQPAKVEFTFTTAADTVIFPLQAATDAATGISSASATLNAGVVPGNAPPTANPAEVWFEYGKGAALDRRTPTQAVPMSGAATPVSASVADLEPKTTYSYRVVAQRNGARVEGAVRTFTTTTIACAPGFGYQTVTVGRVRAEGCFIAAGRRWLGSGEILLNGLKLRPATAGTSSFSFSGCGDAACQALQSRLRSSGSFLYLDEAGRALGTSGTWDLVAGSVGRVYRGALALTSLDWSGSEPLLQLGADRSVNLYDLPLAGRFTFTAMPNGAGQLGVLVGLPAVFGGMTGESKVGLTPGGDVQLDGLRVEVGEVNIGGVGLEELSLVYERASDLWRGAAGFTLPMATKVKVGVSVTVVRGRFNEFTGYVDNLNRHITHGIYLQTIGVQFGIDPLRIGGSVGLSAGPKILGTRAIGVDGSFLFQGPRSEWVTHPSGSFNYLRSFPASLGVSGTLRVIEIPLREAWANYYFAHYAWFDLGGRMGYSIKSGSTTIAGLEGSVAAGVHRTDVWMEGQVAATIMGYDIAKAAAIANTRGISACGAVFGVKVGGYQRWGGSNGHFWACDIGTLRAKIANARGAQAGSGTVALDDPRQAMIRLVGAGAPPEVDVTGPDGERIEMPPAGQLLGGKDGEYVVVRDPTTNATSIIVVEPGSGRWRYETREGSAPVRTVQTAGSLQDPRVRARVVRTKKDRRRGTATLRWRLNAQPGQKVTFTEQGAGVPSRVIAVTSRARGSKRFRPAVVPEDSHEIVARVDQNGRPRSTGVVARFTAPAQKGTGKPRKLRAHRRGARLRVTWKRVTGALRYDVTVVRADGSRSLVRTRRTPRLVIRDGAGVRRVRVSAVGVDGLPGPAASAKAKAKAKGQAKAKGKRR